MEAVKNKIELLSKEDFLKFIDVNTEIVVVAPWNGQPIGVTIRMLDGISLTSCGDFNTITGITRDDEDETPFTTDDIIATKNIHENILKLCMVHPTFNEVEEHLMGKDFYKNVKQQVIELEELLEHSTSMFSEVQKAKYATDLDMLELSIAFLMPEDFTTFIVTIIMQQEATDLNKLTRDTLLKTGFLAEKYNIRPSDYLDGLFTEKQKMDIDVTALTLVADYREQQNIEKNGMHWIRGKGKKKGK